MTFLTIGYWLISATVSFVSQIWRSLWYHCKHIVNYHTNSDSQIVVFYWYGQQWYYLLNAEIVGNCVYKIQRPWKHSDFWWDFLLHSLDLQLWQILLYQLVCTDAIIVSATLSYYVTKGLLSIIKIVNSPTGKRSRVQWVFTWFGPPSVDVVLVDRIKHSTTGGGSGFKSMTLCRHV